MYLINSLVGTPFIDFGYYDENFIDESGPFKIKNYQNTYYQVHLESIQYTGVEKIAVGLKANFEVNREFIFLPSNIYRSLAAGIKA